MGNKKDRFAVVKPISIWNAPLQFKFKDFFKALTDVILNSATGKFDKAVLGLSDAVLSLGIRKDAGQLAWLLIIRSLTNSIQSLVLETEKLRINALSKIKDDFYDEIEESLQKCNFSINMDFFEHPTKLEIFEYIVPAFESWLMKLKLNESEAKSISDRLPIIFQNNLIIEWVENISLYSPISDVLNVPFTKLCISDQAWERYNAFLKKQTSESVFHECFSSTQLYIPLRASIKDIKRESKYINGSLIFEDMNVMKIIDLEAELDDWLECATKDNPIRVISGGPGSGKSTFSKMYCSHVVSKYQIKVLYIPLFHIDPMLEISISIGNFITIKPANKYVA